MLKEHLADPADNSGAISSYGGERHLSRHNPRFCHGREISSGAGTPSLVIIVWLLLLLLTWPAAAEAPEDVESTLHPLTAPCNITLEKLDLDFDFAGSKRPGIATVHLDARLANPRSDAQDGQLILVTADRNMQLLWEGKPLDSTSLSVPFPDQGSRAIPVAMLRIIMLAKESGHLTADYRIRSLAGVDHTWEFLFRLPDKAFWGNIGPAVIQVKTRPDLEIECSHKLAHVQEGLLGCRVSPFHDRKLRFLVRWKGPRPEVTVCVAATLAAWAGLLVTLPVARRLGRVGSFLLAGLSTLGAGYAARLLIEREGLLLWTTPAGSWSEVLPQLILAAAAVSAVLAAFWAGGKRKAIQAVEQRADA